MVPASTLTPAEIATSIGSSWAAFLAKDRRPAAPHDYVYASSWRACERRMAYELTIPDQQPPFPPEVIAKFRRGDDRERDLLADLMRIGRDAEPAFKVVGQQERFQLKDHKSRVAIVGKVDARLEVEGQRPPIEVKAWSPMMVDRIETFEDLFENPWTRSGGYQLLSYLYGAGEPYGFLLLDRSGIPRLLPVVLDENLDRMEEFLARAERVLDHVQAGTLPDYLDDSAECRRCAWYGHTCNPPLSAVGATVLTDPDLEATLERWEALKPAGREFLDLDRDVKARLRGIESGIAGKFSIAGKWAKQSRLDLPANLKKQYTVTDPERTVHPRHHSTLKGSCGSTKRSRRRRRRVLQQRPDRHRGDRAGHLPQHRRQAAAAESEAGERAAGSRRRRAGTEVGLSTARDEQLLRDCLSGVLDRGDGTDDSAARRQGCTVDGALPDVVSLCDDDRPLSPSGS
jgi:hypothetical protein